MGFGSGTLHKDLNGPRWFMLLVVFVFSVVVTVVNWAFLVMLFTDIF